ncbi:hypothetical protein QP938_09185 [Porticoccaceae bacterium LTM1]|nr:hypothetical protein QP938_09185 [Porticoccaceae bacterium LTM1]
MHQDSEDPDTWLSRLIEERGVSSWEALLIPPIILSILTILGISAYFGIGWLLEELNPETESGAKFIARAALLVPALSAGWLFKSLAGVASSQVGSPVKIMQWSFLGSALGLIYVCGVYVF